MKTQNAFTVTFFRLMTTSVTRLGIFLMLIAFLAIPFFSTSSASVLERPFQNSLTKMVRNLSSPNGETPYAQTSFGVRELLGLPAASAVLPVFPTPQATPVESVAVFQGGQSSCVIPATDFTLGQNVCVKITGAPLGLRATQVQRRLSIVGPGGYIRSQLDVPASSSTAQLSFTIPAAVTSFIGGETIDNRGTWGVISISTRDGSVRAKASFSVTDSDPAVKVADLSIQSAVSSAGDLAAGENVSFTLYAVNAGPNSAENVQITAAVPANTTFVPPATSDPNFTCSNGQGSTTCTTPSMAKGAKVKITLTYKVLSGTPVKTEIINVATISSTTPQRSTRDDITKAVAVVTGSEPAPSTCTLICPPNISTTNDPGTAGRVIFNNITNFPPPTTSGDCGSVSTSASPDASGNYFFPIGTTTVTASTESGDTCVFTVTVNDTEAPTITCPGDISDFEDSLGLGKGTVDYTVTAADNSGEVKVSCDRPSGSEFEVGPAQLVTCTATDAAGLSSSCTFNVTVSALAQACTITQPDITTTSSDASCGANVEYSVITTGECGTLKYSRRSGSFFPVGETSVTVVSSEGARVKFKVNVNDETAPVPKLATLPTLTSECSVTAGVPTTIQTPTGPKQVIEIPSATDNCGNVTASTDDARTYDLPGSHDVRWTYTDSYGNTSSQIQTVIVLADTTAPVPDLASLPTITAECSATVTAPTAMDNCSGEITATTTDPTTYDVEGAYTIHWTYTDEAGKTATQNQTVVIDDTTAPVPDLAALPTVTGECPVSIATAPTAKDNCAGTITGTTTDALTYSAQGTFTVNWAFNDGRGNVSHQTQTVIVNDTTPPTIALKGANDLTVECHTSFTDLGATATDGCAGSFAATPSGTVDANTVGIYRITYSATDPSGNTASAVTRTVNVVDTTKPVIAINGASSVTVECPTSYTDAGATASDSCDASVPITTTGSVDVNTVGIYTITYNASDDSSNAALPVTRTVNVVDTTLPSIAYNNLTIFFNNLTIVFNTNSYTVNGVTYPFNGVSCTHSGYTFSFNGQTVTVTKSGYSYAYTFSGKTLVLWTPTHQYQTVNVADLIQSAADSCNTALGLSNVVIEKVSSDEPQDIVGGGDGNTVNDVVIAPDCKSVQLRAERNGSGNGRVYTITFRVRDAAGNATTATSKINIFANSFNVVDDGPSYTVNSSCP